MGLIALLLGVLFWAGVFSFTDRVSSTLALSVLAGGLVALVRYPGIEDMAAVLDIAPQGFGEFFLKVAAAQAIWALLGIGLVTLKRRFFG